MARTRYVFSLYTNAVVDIISYTRNSGMSLDITLIDLSTNDLKNLLNILYSKLYKNVDIINAVREDGYERVHDDC
jgi:hypothetical protein